MACTVFRPAKVEGNKQQMTAHSLSLSLGGQHEFPPQKKENTKKQQAMSSREQHVLTDQPAEASCLLSISTVSERTPGAKPEHSSNNYEGMPQRQRQRGRKKEEEE